MTNLEKFKKRLLTEAALKAGIYSLSMMLVSITFLNILLYFLKLTNLLITIPIGVVLGVISFLFLFFRKYRLTQKSLAKRIDEIGLEERTITMLEFLDVQSNSNPDSFVIDLQKNDTAEHLNKVSPQDISLKVAKSSFIILIICAIFAIPSFFLQPVIASDIKPVNPVEPILPDVPSEEDQKEEEINDIIEELLAELHKIVDEAAVKQEIKDILNGIIDKLEEDLKAENLTLAQKITLIEIAKDEILNLIEENTTFRMLIASVLKIYPLTKTLGEVISDRKIVEVEDAMNGILNQLQESGDVSTFNSIILLALSIAKDEDNLALIEALQTLSDDLSAYLERVTPMKSLRRLVDSENTNKSLEEIFQEATENIKNALMADEQTEEIGTEIATEIQEALDKITDVEQGTETSEEEKLQDERPSVGGNEGDPSEEDTPPVNPDDDDPLDSEKVIDGNTPYLEIFQEYYEQIIEYLNNNEIDDEVRQVIETYLKMLK